jgi:hypothetical protein
MPSKKAKSAFVAALPYACRLWASRLRFSIVQLRGLEAHVISQTGQEGKERLHVRFVICHTPLSKAPPLFFSPLQYTASDAFDAAYRGEVFDQLQHGKVFVFGFYHEIHVAPEFL